LLTDIKGGGRGNDPDLASVATSTGAPVHPNAHKEKKKRQNVGRERMKFYT